MNKYKMYECIEKQKEEEHKQYLKFKKLAADQFLANEKGYNFLKDTFAIAIETKNNEVEIELESLFGVKKIIGVLKFNKYGNYFFVEDAEENEILIFKQSEYHKLKSVKIKGDE